MSEGDYGIALPVTVSGVEFAPTDTLVFTFKTAKNGETILTKSYTDIQDNTVELILSENESALFPVGGYVYCLDWYNGDSFLCNIIPSASLKVVDKA